MTSSKTHHAYLFEAKGIGRYILTSGKMRDLIGASDLVANLASSSGDDLIAEVLNEAFPPTYTEKLNFKFSRRSGGSFCTHSTSEPDLKRFSHFWRLKVMRKHPGLEISDSWGIGKNHKIALANAYSNIPGIRENGVASLLPVGGSTTLFAPQTGLPAVKEWIYPKDGEVFDTFIADIVTNTQRMRGDYLQGKIDGIARKCLPESWTAKNADSQEYFFPRNLEDTPNTFQNPSFPHREKDKRVAMVHADLSGLGEIFRKASAGLDHPEHIKMIADRIEEAIELSVQNTIEKVLKNSIKDDSLMDTDKGKRRDVKIIPARPVVLGGDDITILVRADLALKFTHVLLEELEIQTADAMVSLNDQLGELERNPDFESLLPTKLSACAGVVVAKPGQPFLFMSSLAEDLCKFAKKHVKASVDQSPYPSALAFHVVGTTLQQTYSEDALGTGLLEQDLTALENRRLTGNPYWLDEAKNGYANFDQLEKLANALGKVPGLGQIRRMKSEYFVDVTTAQTIWDRWQTVRQSDDRTDDADWQGLTNALSSFGNFNDPFLDGPKQEYKFTPLFDALELIDIGHIETAELPIDSQEHNAEESTNVSV